MYLYTLMEYLASLQVKQGLGSFRRCLLEDAPSDLICGLLDLQSRRFCRVVFVLRLSHA